MLKKEFSDSQEEKKDKGYYKKKEKPKKEKPKSNCQVYFESKSFDQVDNKGIFNLITTMCSYEQAKYEFVVDCFIECPNAIREKFNIDRIDQLSIDSIKSILTEYGIEKGRSDIYLLEGRIKKINQDKEEDKRDEVDNICDSDYEKVSGIPYMPSIFNEDKLEYIKQVICKTTI